MNLVEIYPNPIKTTAVISFSNENIDSYQIFDLTGREILGSTIQSNSIELLKSDFNAGTYVLVLKSNNTIVSTEKLIFV